MTRRMLLVMFIIGIVFVYGCGQSVANVSEEGLSSETDELAKKKALFEKGTPVEGDHSGFVDEEVDSQIEQEQAAKSADVGIQKGNLAPDFSVTLDGEETSLRELSSDGKPVLVYFMATWCPHCANDFKELDKIYTEYKDDVQIVASSLDLREGQSKLDTYKERYPNLADMPLLEGQESMLRDYNVRYTTTKYGLGRDGTILYAGSGEFSEQQWRVLLDTMKAT